MTRKNRRDIEQAVDELGGNDDDNGQYGPVLLYETEDGYTDFDGKPVPTDEDGELLPSELGVRIVFPGESVRDTDEDEP